MIVDLDDFHPDNQRMDLLLALKDANPKFRVTLFAIPGLGTDDFWDSLPDWIELAVHGRYHPHPRECENWTANEMRALIADKPARFVDGFKAPGWQISDGCYEALAEAGWWLADQPYNDDRRPEGLLTHLLGDGDHWHGHIQDWGSNGLQESWADLLPRVEKAKSFELISEVVQPWK